MNIPPSPDERTRVLGLIQELKEAKVSAEELLEFLGDQEYGEAAISVIYERFGKSFLRTATQMVGRGQAEDVVQESLVSCWLTARKRNADGLKPIVSIGYIYKTIINDCKRRLEKRAKLRAVPLLVNVGGGQMYWTDIECPDPTPYDDLTIKEAKAFRLSFIEAIDEEHRHFARLVLVHNLKGKELRKALQAPVEHANRLNVSRSRLISRFQTEFYDRFGEYLKR